MTWNVHEWANFNKDDPDTYSKMLKLVEEVKPDVLGVQEAVNLDNIKNFNPDINGYKLVKTELCEGDKYDQYTQLYNVLYCSTKYNVLKQGHFKLNSETTSKYYNRCGVYIILEYNEIKIAVVNLHLTIENESQRIENVK